MHVPSKFCPAVVCVLYHNTVGGGGERRRYWRSPSPRYGGVLAILQGNTAFFFTTDYGHEHSNIASKLKEHFCENC